MEEQHAENVPAAKEHGWRLAEKSYKDVGSASRYATKLRDEFKQLLIDLESGSVFAPGDILIMWEPSRGSRKTSEWSAMIELCEQRKVSIFDT